MSERSSELSVGRTIDLYPEERLSEFQMLGKYAFGVNGFDDHGIYYGWNDDYKGDSEDEREISESTTESELSKSSKEPRDFSASAQLDDRSARRDSDPELEGFKRLQLSPLTQELLGCRVDKEVTTEAPWIYVAKEAIEENMRLRFKSSEFWPLRDAIQGYPGRYLLMGYSPSVDERPGGEGRFVVCLTEEARDFVARSIETKAQENERMAQSAVVKRPNPWKSLGSEQSVEWLRARSSRPLLEMEIETTAGKLAAEKNLGDSDPVDRRDGYAEILSLRQRFDNVQLLLVEKATEASPIRLRSSSADQTIAGVRVNGCCHARLDKESSEQLSPDFVNNIGSVILAGHVDEVCRQLQKNKLWDVYASDLVNLARTGAGPLPERAKPSFEETGSYGDPTLSLGQPVCDLAWHPHRPGICAVAYAARRKASVLNPPLWKVRSVLVWSLDDCLKPRLQLLSRDSEVRRVAFCPLNANVLVGGCSDGRVIVWDASEALTTATVKAVDPDEKSWMSHGQIMKNLPNWMQLPEPLVVETTAVSRPERDQTARITQIQWLSPYRRINDKGVVQELQPENDVEPQLSSQFAASSEDGSIAFYDLDWKPPPKKKDGRKDKVDGEKEEEEKEEEKKNDSLYAVLDGLLKPLYMVKIQLEGSRSPESVTCFSLSQATPKIEPIPDADGNDPVRRCKRTPDVARAHPAVLRLERSYKNCLAFVGTTAGDCGLVTWRGVEYDPESDVNRRKCEWLWRRPKAHDGPVHLVRGSPHLRDVQLTVGGRVFALWRTDCQLPLLRRTGESNYSAGCWLGSKASAWLLGREDGLFELWDAASGTDAALVSKSLCSRLVCGLYSHERPRCFALGDHDGSLRIFQAVGESLSFDKADVGWMRRFVDREIRLLEKQLLEEKAAAPVVSTGPEEPLEGEESKEPAQTERRKPLQVLEDMRQRWVAGENARMQAAILERKGLREEELLRRREPILRMKRELRRKQERRERVMASGKQIFQATLAAEIPGLAAEGRTPAEDR